MNNFRAEISKHGADYRETKAKMAADELKEAHALLLKQNERLKLATALYFAVASFLDPCPSTSLGFDQAADEFARKVEMGKACRAYEARMK